MTNEIKTKIERNKKLMEAAYEVIERGFYRLNYPNEYTKKKLKEAVKNFVKLLSNILNKKLEIEKVKVRRDFDAQIEFKSGFVRLLHKNEIGGIYMFIYLYPDIEVDLIL